MSGRILHQEGPPGSSVRKVTCVVSCNNNAQHYVLLALAEMLCDAHLPPQELDEQLYEDCKRAYEEGRQQEQQRLESRERKWHVLQSVAVQRAPK